MAIMSFTVTRREPVDLVAEIAAMRVEMEALASSVATMASDASVALAAANAASSLATAASSSVSALDTEVTEDITSLAIDLTATSGVASGAATNVATLTDVVTGLSGDLVSLDTTVVALNDDVVELDTEVATNLTTTNTAISAANTAIATTNSEIATTNQTVATNLTATNQTISTNLTTTNTAISNLAADVALRALTTAVDAGLSTKQALDATLSALAGLDGSAGLIEQISLDTFVKRLIGAGTAGSILTRADGDVRWMSILSFDDLFGTGQDGDGVISVDTNMARPMQWMNCTVDAGFALNPNRYPFWVRNNLIVNGSIRQNGGAAPGLLSTAAGTAGGQTSAGTLLGLGQIGQLGGSGAVAAHSAFANQPYSLTATQCKGGNGGTGSNAAGTAIAGGVSGSLTLSAAQGTIYVLDSKRLGMFSHTFVAVNGGGGGGGGGGDTSAISNGSGGGGGGGGGVIAFAAKNVIVNPATGSIEARGGAGGPKTGVGGTGSSGTGSGSGGGGGKVIELHHSWTGPLPDVSGGLPGATAGGTGQIGQSGGPGLHLSFVV